MQGDSATGNRTITRLGAKPVTHTFTVNYSIGSTAVKIPGLHISASSSEPSYVFTDVKIGTVFNASTTNVLTIGTTTAANEIVTSSGIDESTATFQPNVGALKLTADADVYVRYTQTGTAATTGQADFFLRIVPVNTIAIT